MSRKTRRELERALENIRELLDDDTDDMPEVTSEVSVVTQEDVNHGADDGEVVTVTRNPAGGE